MPSPPFVYGIHDDRFYGPPAEESVWTSGQQPVSYPARGQALAFAGVGLGIGAASLFGRYRFATGKRGWDYIIQAVRAVEEYSPGRVFRTFQVSHLLSPLETVARQYRYFSPELLAGLYSDHAGLAWLEHVQRLTGHSDFISKVTAQGFRFEGGQLRLGREGGEVLLARAGVMRAPTGAGPRLQEAYARSLLGGPLTRDLPLPEGMPWAGRTRYETQFAESIFGRQVKYLDKADRLQREVFMFTGGRNRLQAAKRYLFGYGTALTERINQLARAPFELPVISGIMQRLPIINRLRLGVVPSSGLKTFGKITAKLGILGTATYMAYQELDYLTREAEMLDKTIFAEGITAALATGWTKAQMGLATAAEWTGAQAYREWQEEVAPRSTELSTLLAFPMLGAAAGLLGNYGYRIAQQAKFHMGGMSLAEASLLSQAEGAFFKETVFGRTIPEELTRVLSGDIIQKARDRAFRQRDSLTGRIALGLARHRERRTVAGTVSRLLGDVTPARLRWLAGAGIGAALILPFLPGALVPGKRPEELEALYSGEQMVPIRKGRWWEFGRSPYEGGRIERYRPHWYPRMLARAREKAIWGEDVPSPFEQWWIENFTYELEKRHYRERPYPVTGTAFEDIPFIGPLLAGTIGRLIKPPVRMHEEEWRRGGEVRRPHLRYGEEVLPGELERGEPISPYGVKGTLGEQAYRLTEMIGLPGFTMTAIKEAITGTPDLFDQEMQLESARRMYGAERAYWELELGGGLGMTELIRRLYPHRRRQIELYNPIRNLMPEWLPGPGERAPDFLHGDPYIKVPEGETRLPGPGYTALHPELKGIAPEDYPLIHRFSILADVGPYTDKFKRVLGEIRAAISKKNLSKEDIATYKEVMRQLKERKTRRRFTPYKYKERARTPMEQILADANELEKEARDEPSWFERTIGRYWEEVTHRAESPFEYLTPVSPAHKLIHARTAVEDYAANQVWGTENAFWGHPLRDFFGPFMESTKHAFGWEGIPEIVQEKRDLEEYFDILKYIKYTKLKRAARFSGDTEAIKEYESKRRETLFGLDPYTYNFSYIFRALPRRDRDYFNEFVKADMEERVNILKMIPENEQALMMARWKLKDAEDMKKAIKKGLLTEEQVGKAEEAIRQMYREKETEGLPKTQELWAEYLVTRLPGESYADWYRRTKLLVKELEGRPVPGPDWVGWHPAVDLDDIKLKIVMNEGKNMYDYDLWPDRLRAVARRPFLEEAVEALEGRMGEDDLRARIQDVLTANNIRASYITVTPNMSRETVVDLNLEQDRHEEIQRIMRRGLN